MFHDFQLWGFYERAEKFRNLGGGDPQKAHWLNYAPFKLGQEGAWLRGSVKVPEKKNGHLAQSSRIHLRPGAIKVKEGNGYDLSAHIPLQESL